MHRFYLHGWRDRIGWILPWPSLLGILGVLRIRQFGVDDQLSWLLVPLLGFTIAGCALTAIVYGLTSAEKWQTRFNPDADPQDHARQHQLADDLARSFLPCWSAPPP